MPEIALIVVSVVSIALSLFLKKPVKCDVLRDSVSDSAPKEVKANEAVQDVPK